MNSKVKQQEEVTQRHWLGAFILVAIVALILVMLCGTVLGSVYLIWGQC